MDYRMLRASINKSLSPDYKHNPASLEYTKKITNLILNSAEEFFYNLKNQKDIKFSFDSINQEFTITAKVSIDDRVDKIKIETPITKMGEKMVHNKSLTINAVTLKKSDKPTNRGFDAIFPHGGGW